MSNGVQRIVQSAWVRPMLFLVLLVVVWDLAIRVFRIPPYQIPKPEDVLRTLSRGSCSRRYSELRSGC